MLNNKLSIVTGVLMLAMLSDTAIAQSDFYVFGTFGNTNSDISFNAQNRIDGDTEVGPRCCRPMALGPGSRRA